MILAFNWLIRLEFLASFSMIVILFDIFSEGLALNLATLELC